jgi:hypothetical protein
MLSKHYEAKQTQQLFRMDEIRENNKLKTGICDKRESQYDASWHHIQLFLPHLKTIISRILESLVAPWAVYQASYKKILACTPLVVGFVLSPARM